jgi:hypothetical protein
VVLLVPPGLEVAATAHGFTAETLLTESAWNDLHGEGWSAYLRGRIRTARATFDASAVALWDTHSDATVMDVIEAAGAPPPAR